MTYHTDPLSIGIFAGIISGIIVVIGLSAINQFIFKYFKTESVRNDIIKFFQEIPEKDDYIIWINEIKEFLREKSDYIKFDTRHWLLGGLVIIEQSIDKGKLPNTEIDTTVENIRTMKL